MRSVQARHASALLRAAGAAVIAGLLLTAAPAGAAPGPYSFSTSFGEPGSGAGQLSLVATGHFGHEVAGSGLAVNSATHDVYVADTGNNRVDQFTSAGVFIRAWGWGVKNGAEEFQICTSTCQAGLPGSKPGQFEESVYVAVDNSAGSSKGAVYVADPAANLVSKFDKEGKLASNWGKSGQLDGSAAEGGPFLGNNGVKRGITGIATDTSGNLFVYEDSAVTLFKFAPSGAAGPSVHEQFADYTLPAGLAVDTTGHFYKAGSTEGLTQYDFSGKRVGAVYSGEGVFGFAFDPSDNNIYSGESYGGLIRRYVLSPASCAPGTGDKFSQCNPVETFGSGHLSESAGVAVDPVADHTVYVANAGTGDVAVFTAPVVPAVTADPATNVAPSSATLNGHLVPEGGEVTECQFEYVDDAAFQATRFEDLSSGGTLPCAEGNNFNSESDVHADIAELELSAETTYHFRLDVANANGQGRSFAETFTTLPAVTELSTDPATELSRTGTTLNGSFEGNGKETHYRFEYVTGEHFQNEGFANATSTPEEDAGTPAAPTHKEVSFELTGLQLETEYRYRILASNEYGTTVAKEQTFNTLDAVIALSTEAASEIANESATLNASFSGEEGLETTYFFEYGTTAKYGHKTPIATFPGTATGAGAETQNPSAHVENLVPGATYHFRVVAEDSYGTTLGQDETFSTYQPPTIDGFSTSHVTATSADLEASINPREFPTEYRFEYGITTDYGQSTPTAEINEELSTTHSVVVEISGLQHGATYHFRLVAENKWGTVTSEDQSFEFFPPACPNSAVRQQTGSAYLPDCRAYELVSPGSANGTLLYAGGPNTGQATSPSRLSFVGAFSSLPGAGEVIGTAGDLYVATRTNTGWVSKYVGLPGNQSGCVGGPPNHPLSHASFADKIQNFVLTDPAMDRFLDWSDGASAYCILEGNGTGDVNGGISPASNAPYLWGADGTLLAHLPTDLGATPGAAAAFTCPYPGPEHNQAFYQVCSGDVAASGDLSHLVFSSNQLSFAENEAEHTPGLTEAPGSAYDNDVATGTVKLISLKPNGEDIPQDPTFATVPPLLEGGFKLLALGGEEEFIRFPAVSTDGSRILMSTATAVTPFCYKGGQSETPCPLFTDTPIHLYMRVNDAVTFEIAEDLSTGQPAAVNYVGTTPDLSKVYFTSEEHLTHEDEGHGGASLYVWSAEKAEEGEPPLTLISKANPGSAPTAGDTEECEASWITKCGVMPYSGWDYAAAQSVGGNGISDTAIAANGDIYFYSPEQLDGTLGVPDQQNLYDYRDGSVQFVATFAPGHTCAVAGLNYGGGPTGGLVCSTGPIARLEVSPDDSHMAFVTADRITSYDNTNVEGSCQNNAHGEPTGETQCTEMYSYTPASGTVVCNSCNPNGQPPTTDVWASQDGRFMADDGRTFWSTSESLVPQDTNEGYDVYEFVEGRPQLITTGTGTASVPTGVSLVSLFEVPGLVGVSANGTDVYFSTYDTLTSDDHNGHFLKFYDARTNGGFLQPAPVQPCAAAEECHGPGTEAPTTLQITSNGAPTKGGNAGSEFHAKRHKKKSRKRRHKKIASKHHPKRAVGKK